MRGCLVGVAFALCLSLLIGGLALYAVPFFVLVGGVTGLAAPRLPALGTTFLPLGLVLALALPFGEIGAFVLAYTWPISVLGAPMLGGVLALAHDRDRDREALEALET